MEEGVLRANVIEAKINDVSVKYERANPGADDTEYDYYAEGKIVPADRIIQASGFKVRPGVLPLVLVLVCLPYCPSVLYPDLLVISYITLLQPCRKGSTTTSMTATMP